MYKKEQNAKTEDQSSKERPQITDFAKDALGRPIYKPVKGKPSRWPKGVSGNLKGRPKGTSNKFSIASLAKAIKFVEEEERKQFIIQWIESSWGDASAMAKIVEFMMPRLKSVESLVSNIDSSMSDKEAAEIRKKLKKRFNV